MTTDDPATVLVVDDHQFIAAGLVRLLRDGGFEADAVRVTDQASILAIAAGRRPGVVLLDLDLGPGPDDVPMDGAELVAPLRTMGWTVLVITGTSDLDRIAAAVASGAANWITKGVDFEEIARLTIEAAHGRGMLPPAERAALVARHQDNRARQQGTRTRLDRLSAREREVLDRLADGVSPTAIAADSYISIGTVRAHIRSILLKLDVNSQLAAVALARRHRTPPAPITVARWRRMLHREAVEEPAARAERLDEVPPG